MRGNEETLDVIGPVSEGDDELGDSVSRVVFHYVPEDRPTAYVDHRLGPRLRLLSQTCTLSSGENHCFHVIDYA